MFVGIAGGILVLCCVITGIAVAISNNGGSASATATTGSNQAVQSGPTATPKPKSWVTIKTFSGNGDQQTGDFTVPNANFRLLWSCNPNSFAIGSYNVAVDVDPVDQTQIGDLGAINTICQAGNTSGETNIHDLSGTLYLSVTSEAAWTIKIQVYQ
jgi:hypothetical protein